MDKIFLIAVMAVFITNCQSTGSAASQHGAEADDCCSSEISHGTSSEASGTGNTELSDIPAGVFSDVTGKEWKLSFISLTNSIIILDREKFAKEGFGDNFTLKFDADMVSGKGDPNLYSAPYSRDNQKVNIKPMRSTLMASIFPNEILNEHEFFLYLQNAYEWKLTGKNLELRAKAADGSDALLVFISE